MKRALIISLALAASAAFAAPRAIPELGAPVIDEAGILDAGELETLSSELTTYPPELQLQVWIVKSLGDDAIENLSIRATEKWRLGTKKEDRGALLLVAVNDHRMRLEVGRGLEGDITDLQSSRVLDNTLRPAFRQGAYFDGLIAAAREIDTLAGGKPRGQMPMPPHQTRGPGGFHLSGILLFFLILFIVNLFGIGRRRRSFFGGWGGGGGFGGGGFGGGGGWSGGGGGFNGGGSSGSW